MSAQTTSTATPTVIVGQASLVPTIDGQWQQGEWDNVMEYQLNVGSQNLNGHAHPYVRFTHDDSNIYGLVDVPSDDGHFYVDNTGNDNWGSVWLQFSNEESFFSSGTVTVYMTTNQTQRATVSASFFSFSTFNFTEIPKTVSAAFALIPTVHSSVKHRVWEFSSQLRRYVTNSSLSEDTAGLFFSITVQDSLGNKMYLLGANQYARIDFTATPVPETTSALMMLPFAMFLPLLLLRRRKILQQD